MATSSHAAALTILSDYGAPAPARRPHVSGSAHADVPAQTSCDSVSVRQRACLGRLAVRINWPSVACFSRRVLRMPPHREFVGVHNNIGKVIQGNPKRPHDSLTSGVEAPMRRRHTVEENGSSSESPQRECEPHDPRGGMTPGSTPAPRARRRSHFVHTDSILIYAIRCATCCPSHASS